MPSSFSLFFPRPYLLVANLAQKGPVLRYDLGSGDFVDSFIVVERPDPQFGSIYSLPYDVQIGPDGGVYVLVLNPREVWRYSPAGKSASIVCAEPREFRPNTGSRLGWSLGRTRIST